MATSPVVEWRSSTTPFGVLTSIAMTGSGVSGAIPLGTASGIVSLRVYNNFAAATGIADCTNCILASYDDTTHQGTAITSPTLGFYLSVEVIDYNGTTTSQDTLYYNLGGSTKHTVPVNSAVLSGSGANYFSINLQITIPSTSSAQGTISQGLWLEYSSTA